MKQVVGDDTDLDLRTQLLRECVAMAKYALAGGQAVPASAAATIDAAAAALAHRRARASNEGRPAGSEGAGASAGSAATDSGTSETSSGKAAATATDTDIRKLVAVHERLAQIVAPATPQAILLFGLGGEAGSRTRMLLGPVPLVRRMLLAAIVSLLLFMGMALFPDVTGDISFQDASSTKLLLNLLFLLAAAGLGASFAALFKVNRYIAEANYDPKYEASYWIRFSLGLIAGFILAELIPLGEIPAVAPGEGNPGQVDLPTTTDVERTVADLNRLAKPLLALLGGFSAEVVFRIMTRFVAAVDTIVRGETHEIVAAREQAAKARLTQQAVQDRMATVSRLIALQQQLEHGIPTDKVRANITEILDQFIGGGLTDFAPADKGSIDRAAGEQKPNATPPKARPPTPDPKE